MFVKISSLVFCLVLIQSTLNAAASRDPSRQRHPRALNINDVNLFINGEVPPEGDVYEGSDVRIDCYYATAKANQWWTRSGKNITRGEDAAYLVLKNVTSTDSGTYICNARLKSGGSIVSKKIEIKVTVPKVTPVEAEHTVKVKGNVTLSCLVRKTLFEDFAWRKLDGSENGRRLDGLKSKTDNNGTHYFLNVHLENVSRNDSGTYICEAKIGDRWIENRTHLRVLEKPEISHFNVTPIGAKTIRLNWALFDGNSPVTEYIVSSEAEGDQNYVYLATVKVSNCITCSSDLESDKLKQHKSYRFKIATRNSEGDSNIIESNLVDMSMIDPVETIPTKFTTSTTDHSITINWSLENMRPNSSYHYNINVTDCRKPGNVASYNSTNKATRHVIDKLEPRTTYAIKVRGCLDDAGYEGNKCTEWTGRNLTTKSSNGSSSVSHSTGGFSLITLSTIVSMFLFKYDDVRSFLSF